MIKSSMKAIYGLAGVAALAPAMSVAHDNGGVPHLHTLEAVLIAAAMIGIAIVSVSLASKVSKSKSNNVKERKS